MHIFTYLLILDEVQVLSVYLKARTNLIYKLFYLRLHTDSLFPQNGGDSRMMMTNPLSNNVSDLLATMEDICLNENKQNMKNQTCYFSYHLRQTFY